MNIKRNLVLRIIILVSNYVLNFDHSYLLYYDHSYPKFNPRLLIIVTDLRIIQNY